jgi:hypothetical protein
MMGSIAVIANLIPIYSCHSFIREIRNKNVPEHTIEIPSRSRMTRMNESHEFNGGQEVLS